MLLGPRSKTEAPASNLVALRKSPIPMNHISVPFPHPTCMPPLPYVTRSTSNCAYSESIKYVLLYYWDLMKSTNFYFYFILFFTSNPPTHPAIHQASNQLSNHPTIKPYNHPSIKLSNHPTKPDIQPNSKKQISQPTIQPSNHPTIKT